MIYSLHAVFTGLIAYFWITITPILIRAVLLTKGVTLTSGYAATLQVRGSTIVAWMILASVVRIYIQNKIVFDKKHASLFEEYESEVKQHKAPKDLLTMSRLPWIERALALTGLQLFILQGMLTNPIEYIAIGFSIYLTLAAQNGKIKIELGKLTEDIKKIQPLYRLIGFVVTTFVINSAINKIYYYSIALQAIFFPFSTFFPVVFCIIFTLILYIILFPYTKPNHEEH